MLMKPFFAVAGILISLASAQTRWKAVETLHYDWAGPGKPATLILEIPSDYDAGGEFTRVRILTPGNPEFVLVDEDGLTNFRRYTCQFSELVVCKTRNLVFSERVFFYRLPSGQILVFLFGWGYASSPGSFHVVALDARGMPHEILSLKEFDLYDLVDLDGDGIPEFVGKKCLSQEWGDHLLTYDPYSVYRIPKESTVVASYSLELSKQYNLKNYYGWAGPDCREDVAVVLHPPGGGKPVIINSRDAERLSQEK